MDKYARDCGIIKAIKQMPPAMVATSRGPTSKGLSPMRYEYPVSPEKVQEWRPVVGYEGIYEVSSVGHVRRIASVPTSPEGRILTAHVNLSSGYPAVALSALGRTTSYLLHRVVAEAFLGPRPDGMQVNHRDLNKMNPSIENLEYVTPSQNTRHAHANGAKVRRGTQINNAKLNDDKAREIYISRESGVVLAKRYNVAPSVICKIRRGVTWRHVTKDLILDNFDGYAGTMDRWAKQWDCCVECGTTDRPHHARGLCERCRSRIWQQKRRRMLADNIDGYATTREAA